MGAERIIPYGVINWASLVRECLFVDNTAYIRKLEKIKTPVYLRPKRFGKMAGFVRPARLIEFKYFTRKEVEKRGGGGGGGEGGGGGRGRGRRKALLASTAPDAETQEQALRYREALKRRPDWSAPIETTVVEVYADKGYGWFDLKTFS